VKPRRGRALICAPVPPEYDRESGSRRIYHLIEFLLEAGWTVAFVCENAPDESRHLRHLRQRGVATYIGFGEATENLIEGGRFDVALFAFWYVAHRYADLVRRLSPDTRIIVESVDLHWLRNARRILGGAGGEPGVLDASYGGDLVSELNAYAAADGVLTVSEKEAALVNDVVGLPSLARAVPDCDETPVSSQSFEARSGILFIGNFRHPPNLDAVRYLCGDIMPLLSPRLRARHPLWIVGNGLDGRVEEAVGGCQGVQLVGWVPTLEPYLHAARVSVIPLRYGAGTKRKLIQALLAGTPSVSTPVGVEGLDLTDGEDVLIGDDAVSFARAIETSLVDREIWSRLAVAGRERMLEAHGRQYARARLLEAVSEVLARSPGRRRGEGGRPATDILSEAVEAVVPEGASMLVVSKGDPALVTIPNRTVRHFPQSADGGYAGFHPRDGRAAIEHLEENRGEAQFLVIPAASFWWLEHYAEFAQHLATSHERVSDRDECVIYRLRPSDDAPPGVPGSGQGWTSGIRPGAREPAGPAGRRATP